MYHPILTVQQEQKMIDALKTSDCPEALQFFILAIGTGLRLGELTNLTWNEVKFDSQIIQVESSKAPVTRTVPMSKKVYEVLKDLEHENGSSPFVFGTKPEKAISKVRMICETAAAQTGIEQFRLHDLRYTFTARLLDAGLNQSLIRSMLG